MCECIYTNDTSNDLNNKTYIFGSKKHYQSTVVLLLDKENNKNFTLSPRGLVNFVFEL